MEEEQLLQWEEMEENKRRSLNLAMGAVMLWITISIQLMLPKSEARLLTLSETRLIFGNVVALLIILVFLVGKIEGSFWQILNYAYVYVVYVALLLPHYGVAAEIFIPCWFGACMLYILIVVHTESIPFILYPQRPLPMEMSPPPNTRKVILPSRNLSVQEKPLPLLAKEQGGGSSTTSRPAFIMDLEVKKD